MHGSMFSVTLVPVAVEFIAHDHTPVTLETVGLCLQKALALVECVLLLFLGTVVLDYLLFIWCVVV